MDYPITLVSTFVESDVKFRLKSSGRAWLACHTASVTNEGVKAMNALAKALDLKARLREAEPDMQYEFAEALALHIVNDGRDSEREGDRVAVWFGGLDYANELRAKLAHL